MCVCGGSNLGECVCEREADGERQCVSVTVSDNTEKTVDKTPKSLHIKALEGLMVQLTSDWIKVLTATMLILDCQYSDLVIL